MGTNETTLSIAMVYNHVLNDRNYAEYAKRFVQSYNKFSPGADHMTFIVENRGRIAEAERHLFEGLPNLQFFQHDNSGYDIGAFQHAARDIKCDLMVFFGSSTYLNGDGWLGRMKDSFLKHGNAQYGTMGNRGNLNVKVWPHIRTTAFWMSPDLMNSYPKIVTKNEERHPFEHGQGCLTDWVAKCGLKSWVVNWNTELLREQWDSDPNGYNRGNQKSLLAGDHMCEPPYYKKL